MEYGIVTNWDDMERIWYHVFQGLLHAPPEENTILMTETPRHCHKDSREETTQYMFEKFRVPSFYLASQAALSLYASGHTTGIVLDSGYEVTHAVPICEGIVLSDAVLRLNIGGRDLDHSLKARLHDAGHSIPGRSGDAKEIIREIKENYCYVALDYPHEISKREMKSYRLPDGQSISLQDERWANTVSLVEVAKLIVD